MILFDDLRSTLAETLRSRVLVVFGRAVDAVNVGVEDDLTRGDLVVRGFPQPEAERLIRGMQFPQLIRSASVESDDDRVPFGSRRGGGGDVPRSAAITPRAFAFPLERTARRSAGGLGVGGRDSREEDFPGDRGRSSAHWRA